MRSTLINPEHLLAARAFVRLAGSFAQAYAAIGIIAALASSPRPVRPKSPRPSPTTSLADPVLPAPLVLDSCEATSPATPSVEPIVAPPSSIKPAVPRWHGEEPLSLLDDPRTAPQRIVDTKALPHLGPVGVGSLPAKAASFCRKGVAEGGCFNPRREDICPDCNFPRLEGKCRVCAEQARIQAELAARAAEEAAFRARTKEAG